MNIESQGLSQLHFMKVLAQLLVTLSRCCSCRHFYTCAFHLTALSLSLSFFPFQLFSVMFSHIFYFRGKYYFPHWKVVTSAVKRNCTNMNEKLCSYMSVSERVCGMCVMGAMHPQWLNRNDASEITWGPLVICILFILRTREKKNQRIRKMYSCRLFCFPLSLTLSLSHSMHVPYFA